MCHQFSDSLCLRFLISGAKVGHQLRGIRRSASMNVEVSCDLIMRFLTPWRCALLAVKEAHHWHLTMRFDVVNEILERKGLPICDYGHYASSVECYFTKPYVIPFDECGLPIQISTKIKKYISNDSIDAAIESLKELKTDNLMISSFEKRMIRYVQKNL